MRNAIYRFWKTVCQIGSGFSRKFCLNVQDSWQCFTFEGQICSLRWAFTSLGCRRNGDRNRLWLTTGNLAECSTEIERGLPLRRTFSQITNNIVVFLVNSANVRRFLSRNMGNRRECWKSPIQSCSNPLQKRIATHRCCKFGALI
jgi:hypothetical protein